MSVETISVFVGGAMFVIETIVLFVLIHHLRRLNEHTQKLDAHLERLNVCYDRLHEHSHQLELNVERLCSCILPGGDGGERKAEAKAEGDKAPQR